MNPCVRYVQAEATPLHSIPQRDYGGFSTFLSSESLRRTRLHLYLQANPVLTTLHLRQCVQGSRLRVSEELVCIYLFQKNLVLTTPLTDAGSRRLSVSASATPCIVDSGESIFDFIGMPRKVLSSTYAALNYAKKSLKPRTDIHLPPSTFTGKVLRKDDIQGLVPLQIFGLWCFHSEILQIRGLQRDVVYLC